MRTLSNEEARLLTILDDDFVLNDEEVILTEELMELGYVSGEFQDDLNDDEYELLVYNTTPLGREALRIFNLVKPFLNQ